MSEPYLIGVIGARGHTGKELMRLIGGHPELMLAYASSRELAGRRVDEITPDLHDDVTFEAMDPQIAAPRRADAVILALPDGASAPYVDAFDKTAPHRILIDLSADRRFDDGWAYGLPELHREKIRGARRIANPGCYATAMQLALAPAAPVLAGAPSVFGVSGYSGAGTTPNPRNDVEALAESLIPYALTGHKHEREASRHLGVDVRFSPHVHPAFRGLTVTAHMPLATKFDRDQFRALYAERYGGEPLVKLVEDAPALKDGAHQNGILVGGFSLSEDGRHGVVVAAEDNLLKGAAVQAIQNLNLALGLPEMLGLEA